MKILVVDDDPDFLDLIKVLLRSAGMNHVAVTEPGLVLDMIKKEEFDIITLDIFMPVNGIELAQALREAGYKNPIVMLSSDTSFRKVYDAKPYADEYVTKETVARMLLPVLKRLLEAHA